MKKLIVVASDIETFGKSTLSRTISTYLNENEIKNVILSADERHVENGFAGEFWDFNDEPDAGSLIDALDRHEAVIVDIRSGFARVWAEFCEEYQIDELLGEMDVDMTMVIPCNTSERANEEVVDLAEIFADTTDYIIAHMPFEARGSKEVAWNKSEAAKAVKYLGAIEIEVPAIDQDFVTALESSDFDMVGALDNLSSAPRFVEVQAMQWMENATQVFNEAEEYLIPEHIGGLVATY